MYGRGPHLEVIDRALHAARRGSSRRLVVRGPAGIGKTALLAHVTSTAPGFRRLATVGVSAESELPYAGLGELLAPVVDRLEEIPSVQAAALRAALALGPPTGSDRFAVAAATLALLSIATGEGPLLLVVDDVQWLDRESAEVLQFAVRRLRDEPVCVLFGLRDGEDAGFGVPDAEEIALGPLDDDAARQVLRDVAGGALPAEVEAGLVRAAAGSPLALIEMVRTLDTNRPLQPQVEDLLRRRILAVPPAVRSALLLAAAAAGERPDRVGRACARLGLPTDALARAIDTGLLIREEKRLVFQHPLVRSGVYEVATPAERRRVHAVLAEVAEQDRDHDVVAWHRSAAADGPDEPAARALDTAAGRARDRGAHGSAASASTQAAGLTEDPAQRARRLIAAAESALLAGQFPRARGLLEEAAAIDAADPVALALLQGRLVTFAGGNFAETMDLLERLADRRAAVADPVAVQLYLDAAMLAFISRQLTRAVGLAERARAAVPTGDSGAAVTAEAVFEIARSYMGEQSDSEVLVQAVDALLTTGADPGRAVQLLHQAVTALSSARKHDVAARHAKRFITAAREIGTVGVLPLALCLHAHTSFWSGDWTAGALSASEALQLSEATGQPTTVLYALVCQALYAGARGQRAQCEDAAARALPLIEATGIEMLRTPLISSLGLAALADGDLDTALSRLDEAAAAQQATGPDALVHWRADYVEALVAAGRSNDTEPVLTSLRNRLDGPDPRWERMMLARAAAALSGDDADYAAAVTAAQALTSSYPLARTLLAWGRRLAAAGRTRDARPRMTEAATLFDRLQATGWARLTRTELTALGVPAPVVGEHPFAALPDQVQQLARLVAAGADVEEVAGRLFLGAATARRQLAQAQAALGVTTVDDLSAALHAADGTGSRATTGHSIRMLGAFSVTGNGSALTLPGGLPAQAVKFVAVSGGAVHLDELVEALWPEIDPEVGRRRLRNVLARVRSAAAELLVRRDEAVQLAEGTDVDATRFAALAAQALAAHDEDDTARQAGEAAVAAYGGELLPADRYAEWAIAPRERLQRRYVQVLDLLADLAGCRGDHAVAAGWLERAAEVDPCDDRRLADTAAAWERAGRPAHAAVMRQRAAAVARELGLPTP